MTPPLRLDRVAPILWALLGLFVALVVAQALAAFGVPFSASIKAWPPGGLAFGYRIAAEILIAALLTAICIDLTRGRGFFVRPNAFFATVVLWLGYVYFAAMVLLTVIRMVLLPETSWLAEFLRIAPHFALAAFIILFGLYHRSQRMSAATLRRSGWIRRTSFAGGFLVLFLAIAAAIAATSATDWLAWRLGTRPAEFAVYAEGNVTMQTADGVQLVASIFHPVTDEPAPTLLVRIPYSKTLRNTLFARIVGRFWAERGYHVVIQATRGRYDSGGDYYPDAPRARRRDRYA